MENYPLAAFQTTPYLIVNSIAKKKYKNKQTNKQTNKKDKNKKNNK
jgi:hypothetical protein